MGWLFALIGIVLDWVPPRPFRRPYQFTLPQGLERSNTFLLVFPIPLLANHQAGFSPSWRAIGWFNTMMTGKRRQAANYVQSHFN